MNYDDEVKSFELNQELVEANAEELMGNVKHVPFMIIKTIQICLNGSNEVKIYDN